MQKHVNCGAFGSVDKITCHIDKIAIFPMALCLEFVFSPYILEKVQLNRCSVLVVNLLL